MKIVPFEEMIEEYFQSWVKKDSSALNEYFADNIKYIECYGPEYENKKQCLKWFNDWNEKGSVLEWSIKQIKSVEQTHFVEWYFKCEYEGNIDGFDGVSIIETVDNKISLVKEFQSKSEHYLPYKGF